MTEYTTFSGSGTRAARRGRATHDPEHAPARSFAGRSERSPVSQVSLGLGDPTHTPQCAQRLRRHGAPRPLAPPRPGPRSWRGVPSTARPAPRAAARPGGGKIASPEPVARTRRLEGRTNAFITFPAPKAHSASRTATPCYIVRTLEIAILRLLYTVVCRQLSSFYDYVSLSTCVKLSSEDRSGSAPLDVVYVRSASHGSTEGRSSPWPPIPKGTYASFSSSPSS